MYIFYKLFINTRNFIINNFCKRILLIEQNNKISTNIFFNFIVSFLFYINNNTLKYFNNVNIVYQMDNIVFYNNKDNSLKISNVILESYIDNFTHSNSINLQKYSLNMPLYIIIHLEKININSILNIKILEKTQIINKSYFINDIKNKKLYEL